MAVQFWTGVLHNRCHFPIEMAQTAPRFMPKFYRHEEKDFVCATTKWGMFHCSDLIEVE